jgi:hypothetical protein
MPNYRVTVRWGRPRHQYHVHDVEATSLRDALREAADRLPDEVSASADLAEVRLMGDPDRREYAPG